MTDNPDVSGPDADPASLERRVRQALAGVLPGALEADDDVRQAFQQLLSEGPGRRILGELSRTAVDEALKNVLERRFARMEQKIDKKVSDAGSSVLAQVRGSIEGKVINALSSSTQSKEFRDLLQEITIFSAQQALKDSAGPLFESLREDFQKTLDQTLEGAVSGIEERLGELVSGRIRSFTSEEEFGRAVAGALRSVAAEILEPDLARHAASLREEFEGLLSERWSTESQALRSSLEEHVEQVTARLAARLREEAETVAREQAEAMAASDDLGQKLAEEVEPALGELRLQIEALSGSLESLREAMNRQRQAQEALAEEVYGTEGRGGLAERMGAIAEEAVQKAWTERLAPELSEIAGKMEAPSEGFLRRIITDEVFGERVKVLAGEERRESQSEVETAVHKALEKAGVTADGIPRGIIEEIVGEAMTSSLKDVKALAKRIDPIVRESLQEQAGKSMDLYVTREEMRSLVESELEGALSGKPGPGEDIDRKIESLREDLATVTRSEVKECVDRNISDTLTMVAGSAEIKNALKSALENELLENVILERALQNFLATDEVKEMIDDRFRTIRMFLRNEEIPRIVKKILEERGQE